MLALQIFANNIVTYICKYFKKFSSFCHLDRQGIGCIFFVQKSPPLAVARHP